MSMSSTPTKRRGRGGLAGLAAMSLVVLGLLGMGIFVGAALLRSPFKTESVDRTPPPVLTTLRDLALYKAADGQYEVLVDIEKDVKNLPTALAGERTLFIGLGSVDASVDFRNLGDGAVWTDPKRTAAVITLPHASLGKAMLDIETSRVASRKRGLFNRIAGAFNDSATTDQELYAAASAKMDAAAAESGLVLRAEENTRAMLTTLIMSLGYQYVDVRFEGEAPVGPVAETPLSPSPTA